MLLYSIMRTSIFILIILGLFFSCNRNKESNRTENVKKVIASKSIDSDTVLERSNPKNIDYSQHQLFIDTTKTSGIYNLASKWDNGLTSTNKNLNVFDFPAKFITLRKLNDNFILYDRCDGADPKFVILDSIFVIYGPLEKSVVRINEISITDRKIEFNKNSHSTKITIEKTSKENVYKIHFENHWLNWVEYIAPLNKIGEYELIVNHCPKLKILEFDGFD